MASSWENTFHIWAQPPSQTELEKCERSEREIRNAINASPLLVNRNIRVFPQGSYHNRTNVRTDSDVDMCVLCHDSVFFDLPEGMTPADFNITMPATYRYAEYKNDVEVALISYLGRNAITRGSKAFNIHENTYRIDSDVVACFEYRWCQADRTYYEGTAFLTDRGQRRIFNYPDQNYSNGVEKNDATGHRFKAVVRILKCLSNQMTERGYTAANAIPSFLLECLVYNVPNTGFSHVTYTDDVRYTLAHLYNNTRHLDDCRKWCEINGFKYLFHNSQPWTYQATNDFLLAAWNFVGFE